MQKFHVYVVPYQKDRGKFTIVLRPHGYWTKTITQKPFHFVSQRSFKSEDRAKREASYLFGPVAWKRTPINNLNHALVKCICTSS